MNPEGADSGASMFRAFVAVELPDAVRENLARAVGRLRRGGGHVGWVTPEHLHVTLAFLGEVTPAAAAAVAAALDGMAAAVPPFGLEAAGLGCFGHPRTPRIIWAGLGGNLGALEDLYRRLAAALETAAGWRDDKPFHPHVTLGRVRAAGGLAPVLAELEKRRTETFGCFQVGAVRLMRSDLRCGGPVYAVVHEARLGGASG